jgi:hypothetical protein
MRRIKKGKKDYWEALKKKDRQCPLVFIVEVISEVSYSVGKRTTECKWTDEYAGRAATLEYWNFYFRSKLVIMGGEGIFMI